MTPGSGDPLAFVVDLEGDLLQLIGVLLAVVSTEEELEATGQRDSDIGLRAATVTTICRAQGGSFDDVSAHDRPLFRRF